MTSPTQLTALDSMIANQLPRVLIADDHHLVLDALRVMMASQFDVMGVDGSQAFIEATDSFRPDVAILDISMPDGDGFTTAQKVLDRYPTLPIIFLSTYLSKEYIDRAAGLGAKAYLSKRIPGHELVDAIRSVLEGRTLLNGSEVKPEENHHNPDTLTTRQRQVLTLIARGGSAKDIANQLNISVRTAEFHRAAIMQRLGLRSTAQMTRYAVANNLG